MLFRIAATGRYMPETGGRIVVRGDTAQAAECEANCAHHRPLRLSWAKLLKRVFEIDLECCPNCEGELTIIAAIKDQPVTEKIPYADARLCQTGAYFSGFP